MHEDAPSPGDATQAAIDAAIAELETELPDLQLRHRDLFSLANAWADRHDALLRMAPPALREATQQRLRRIGIRWGMIEGVRVTREFEALEDD